MAHHVGTYYGYREIALPLRPHKRLPPRATPSPPKLNPVVMERLGVPAYDYRVWSGDVPESYPAEWAALPWFCSQTKWTLRGGPIEAQFSYDGSTVGDTRVLRGSTATLDSFRFFRVRELLPGFHSWYQLIAML